MYKNTLYIKVCAYLYGYFQYICNVNLDNVLYYRGIWRYTFIAQSPVFIGVYPQPKT